MKIYRSVYTYSITLTYKFVLGANKRDKPQRQDEDDQCLIRVVNVTGIRASGCGGGGGAVVHQE